MTADLLIQQSCQAAAAVFSVGKVAGQSNLDRERIESENHASWPNTTYPDSSVKKRHVYFPPL